ncbi:hypothetical protein [Deinococcus sonorensis]|uniref:Conjugal transfer protein TrbC n=1 Tax=Deinococcus sonorensis TaxID=309891 RepID=A0ABV8YB66_9DEIO
MNDVSVSALRPSARLSVLWTTPLYRTILLAAFSLLVMAVFGGMAHAQATIGDALTQPGKAICDNLTSLQGSPFVGIIAIAMFAGGVVMWWLKMRGGLALSAVGVLGYFFVRNSLSLAKSFGITSSC